jgi:phosphohistidine phosphatase
MLRLLVLRHAKSDWTSGASRDFDRPLNARGRKAAPLVGAHMATHGLTPDKVLCSPALRTRQTLELVLPHLPPPAETDMPQALYDDGDLGYLDILQTQGGHARCLMVVGHNPACQDTVLELAGQSERGLLDAVMLKYPTATLAVLDLAVGDWRDVRPGCARLAALAQPRHLPAPDRLSALPDSV